MKTKCSLLAFLLLTAAVLRSGGSLDRISLALVLASLATALVGSTTRAARTETAVALPWLLGGLLAVELLGLGLRPESAFLPRDRLALPPVLAAVLLGLLALTYAWKGFPWPHTRLLAMAMVWLGFGAWLLLEVAPAPAIDVWHFQQHAAELLVQGDNPYAGEYPNPYSHSRFLNERMLRDGRIRAFPYPPLSLLLVVPGYLLGDVRWCLLLAMLGSAGFAVATGRRLGLPVGHPAELAAVAVLCNPWSVAVVELAWTEPLVALAASLTTFALASGRRRLVVFALAALLGLKQYGFLLLPAPIAAGHLRWGDALRAAILALLTALPFVLWRPTDFLRGVVVFHFGNPLREDSLSVLAAIAAATGQQLSGWLGLLAALGVGGWVWGRGTPVLSTIPLGSAAVVLAFFVFNRAAHLNYYWLALALLALAVITASAEARRRTDERDCLSRCEEQPVPSTEY